MKVENAPSVAVAELTPQEAEAVLELWAKRQAEGELRTRLNVQDLAEAMSLPISEVEKMVDAVRRKQFVPPVSTGPLKKAKPVNAFLIAVAALVWIGLLVGASAWFYRAGQLAQGRSTRVIQLPSAPLPPMAADTLAAASSNSLANSLPEGLSMEFKGYTLQGESPQTTEWSIREAFRRVIDQVAAPASATPNVVYNDVAIINALQENDAEKVESQIRFEPLTLQAGGRSMTKMVPIAMVNEPNLLRLVEEEQSKRLTILANWAANVKIEHAPAQAR